MSDIFISYARDDHDRARMLARALEARGWSVWWDREIKAGQAFDQVIEEELERAKTVVVLWSKASIASDWVKSEAARAVQRGILVPALIDDVRLPLEFSRRQSADLVAWEGDPSHPGFHTLCNGIAWIAGTTSAAAAAESHDQRAEYERSTHTRAWWRRRRVPLIASAALLMALASAFVIFNQPRAPSGGLSAAPERGTGSSEAIDAQRDRQADPTSTTTASTDRDKPTRLASNEIRGVGTGELTSYYYALTAGPGTVRVTVDGKGSSRGPHGAVDVNLYDMDNNHLLYVTVFSSFDGDRTGGRVQLGRKQQVVMRVTLNESTVDYMVRLEGAVDLVGARTSVK